MEAPPPTVAGAEGGPELAEWKAKVVEATQAIKPPDMGDAAEGGGRVRRLGGGAMGRGWRARRSCERAEELVKPPPSIPDPLLPPEQDPVPIATALVRAASDRKLPNQAMPPLQMTPGQDHAGASEVSIDRARDEGGY